MTRTGSIVASFAALATVTGTALVPGAAPAAGAGSTPPVPAARLAENGRIDGGGSGESLSSKLNKSGGVIAPKEDVDPAIHVTPPDPHPNSTPVIPPSQNGGGSAK